MVFGIPLIFLAGVGPVVAWRKASARQPGARVPLAVPLGRRRPSRCASSRASARASPASSRSASACSSSSASGSSSRAARSRATRSTPGRGWARALTGLIGRNRRRYGGYVVHLGVVVGIVGIIGTTVYATVAEQIVQPGPDAARARLRAHASSVSSGISARTTARPGALLSVRHNGGTAFRIDPSPALLRPRGPDRERGRDPHRLADRQRPVRDLLGHRARTAAPR